MPRLQTNTAVAADNPYRTEIVVPTLAEASRGRQLLRAIDSICSQGARALVVINGSRFDPALQAQLQSLPNVRVLSIAEPGLPNAIHVGFRNAVAPYVGFLDDDDYLLPNSIRLRQQYLDTHADIDAIVANGLRDEWSGNQQLFADGAALERIVHDPLGALLQANWMTPCGVLYRTASVSSAVFANLTKYAEWTDVGFRLIGAYRFAFLFDNTFVQSDTPGSLSKHTGQARFLLELHERIVGQLKTGTHRRLWDRRICRLHHQIVEEELAANNRGTALRHHLRSLLHAPSIGLPSYLIYTRKFFL